MTHLTPTDKTAGFQSLRALGLLAGRVCELPQQRDITLVFCLLVRKGVQRSCFQALYALFLMLRARGIIWWSLEWTPSSPVHEINEDLFQTNEVFSIYSTATTSYVMHTE